MIRGIRGLVPWTYSQTLNGHAPPSRYFSVNGGVSSFWSFPKGEGPTDPRHQVGHFW